MAILRYVLILLAAAVALASPSPTPLPDPCGSILSIVTRPTVSTGVCTVRRAGVLLETGYTNTISAGSSTTAQYPQAFLRLGTGDPHLEFDVAAPSASTTNAGGTRTSGASDVAIGAKVELGYTSKALWGANALATLPTGSHAFTAGAAQYAFNLNWAYTLDQRFGLAGTVGYDRLSGFDSSGTIRHADAFAPSIELTGAVASNAQLFIEYAYASSAGIGLGSRSIVDAGYQRVLSPATQLDVEYGIASTPSGGSGQHYIGFGVAFMH